MTHLLNDDDPQGMVAPQPKLWADYGTPLIQDLWETFTLLWAQTIRPSLKAFYAAVMTAFLKGQSQTSRPARLHPSLSVVRSNAQARKTAVLSETVGLSTESTLSLRRIQGALSDNWAGAPQATYGVYKNKSNRWAQASRRVTPVSTGKAPLTPVKPKAAPGNAPADHEEIRGLDDIFTGPVPGLFVEDSPKRARKSAPASRASVDRPKERPAARATNRKAVVHSPAEQPKPPMVCFDESLRKKVRWPGDTLPTKVTVMASHGDAADAGQDIPAPVEPELYREAEADTEWFNMLEEPAEPALPTTGGSGRGGGGQPRDPVNPPPAMKPAVTAQNNEPNAAPKTQPEAIAPAEQQPKAPAPEPVVPDYSRDAFPVYQPLEDEDSGFDMMVRNNRILSNSITNLVDTYFQRAALDEEANYY